MLLLYYLDSHSLNTPLQIHVYIFIDRVYNVQMYKQNLSAGRYNYIIYWTFAVVQFLLEVLSRKMFICIKLDF